MPYICSAAGQDGILKFKKLVSDRFNQANIIFTVADNRIFDSPPTQLPRITTRQAFKTR